MVRKSALLLFGLAFAEIVVFVFAATRFGVLNLLLVVAVLSLMGGAFLSRQAPALLRRSVDGLMAESVLGGLGRGISGSAADGALKILAGLLLFFPGLLSGTAGGLLLVRPVRAAIGSSFAGRLSNLVPTDLSESFTGLRGAARRRGDFVDATSTTKDRKRGTASGDAQLESP